MTVMRVSGVTKRFPGVVALDDVGFDIEAGEVHCLAGENGSGKSTLAKIMYGAQRPDQGRLEVEGEEVVFRSPADALKHGIVPISQELTLGTTLTVAENVMMGRLPRRRGRIQWGAMRKRARAALDDLGVDVSVDARVSDLSVELQQEVEIARALSASPKLLILDEATSALAEHAVTQLLQHVITLRDRGVGVMLISHRMRELFTVGDRVTVLRDGRYVDTLPLPETPEGTIIRSMVGRDLTDLFGGREVEPGPVGLEVRGVSVPSGVVRDVSFSVRQGEILGVGGVVGCGKTEVAMAIGGALRHTGEIGFAGEPLDVRSPRHAIDSGVRLVTEDRKLSGLLPTRSATENLTLPDISRVTRFGVIQTREETRRATKIFGRLRVRGALDGPISLLSGGNQQKVILGRCFGAEPRVVVLCEPTRGVDVGAKREVYGLVHELAEAGAAVLMISSEMPELLGMSDRIVVLNSGRLVAEMSAAEATEEAVIEAALAETTSSTSTTTTNRQP
jgi:ABC-type sugar transport system ATPase subunit